MYRRTQPAFFAVLSILLIASYASADAHSAECNQTVSMRVYSNAWIDMETGDLNGFELAIKNIDNSPINVLLYMYEGGVAEGIPLPGRISNGRIDIRGDWVEHLIEYPSKKEIIQSHSVKIAEHSSHPRFEAKYQFRVSMTLT
ncbi:MAG: hypothetical protein WA172_17445 [Terriglobales bacterium]